MTFIKNTPARASIEKQKTIQSLFAEQVEKYPLKPAVIQSSSGQTLTYEQLWTRARALASLLQRCGLQCQSGASASLPNFIAGLLMDRSPDMISGVMGIILAGGAYLPLSLDFPAERIRAMLDDANVRILVTELKFKDQAENIRTLQRQYCGNAITHIIYVDDIDDIDILAKQENIAPLQPVITTLHDLVYIIYTSGTTGQPKGVLTRQFNVTRVVVDTNYIDITPDDTLLQLSNYAFDGSIFDIFGALLNGATLVIPDKEDVFSPNSLAQIILENKITVFFITTALFNTLVDLNIECLAGVRKILFGGERVSLEHARKAFEFLGPNRLMNVYGPTETTVFASYYNINHISPDAVTLPIGLPITDTSIYILDRELKPVPEGTEGEIYIGGSGTAAGYMNNPELTAEKFLKNYRSYESYRTSILYKTGDLARWLTDGNIEFLGRIDDQVKIRGFRIEPGEIENRLIAHQDIKEAVVLVKKSEKGDAYLCAYYVPLAHGALVLTVLAEKELKEYLSRFLPAYMIPRFFIPLERMPLNRNGKIDKQALPEYSQTQKMRDGTAVAPIPSPSRIEHALASLCSQLLGIETIGMKEDFFQLGGHSLLAAQLANSIKKVFGVEMPLREIFARPTAAELAAYLKREKGQRIGMEEILPMIRPVSREQLLPLTFQQEQVWFLCRLAPDSKAYNFQFTIRFRGPLEVTILEKCLNTIIQRHEILRTTFREVEVNAGQAVQVIHEPWTAHIPVQDLRRFPLEEREAKAEELIRQEMAQTFDFTRLPLLRWQLYQLGEEDFIYFQVEHHFVHDGWSYAVFLKELKTLYRSYQAHTEPLLPDLPVQYADYAVWQCELSYSNFFKQQLDYWHKKLAGAPDGLALLTDRPARTEGPFVFRF